ncbi:hypothetical protein [Streptomyces sp. NPDC087300]|uniref:hypothetical protein n=1 Tax=Streptomyces sp. NPDC087300 TaxID=3365780 RepID=UPI003807B9D5
MTICDVRHEITMYPRYARYVEEITPDVMAAVLRVTGMRVESPKIRFVSRHVFVRDVLAHQQRAIAREIAELSLPDSWTSVLMGIQEEQAHWMNAGWMMSAGAMIEDPDGGAEILFMPEVFHHAGYRDPEITKAVAHQLVRVAQHRAGLGAITRSCHAAFPHRLHRGVQLHAFPAFAVCGYAEWADREVTRHTFGHAIMPGPTNRETHAFRDQVAAFQSRVENTSDLYERSGLWLIGQSPMPLPPPYMLDAGAGWVSAVVAVTGGPSLLNCMWSTPALIPTLEETMSPYAWVQRARQSITG